MSITSDDQKNYYNPSSYLVDSLSKELQSLQIEPPTDDAGEGRYVRKESSRNRMAKSKHDTFNKIFQSFVDVVYFLEVIESNPELHEMYEDSLKELLGIKIDELDSKGRRRRRNNVWH